VAENKHIRVRVHQWTSSKEKIQLNVLRKVIDNACLELIISRKNWQVKADLAPELLEFF
jgi:hypothetical protein